MNAAIQSSKLLWRVQARHVSKAQCITEEMWMFCEDRKTVIGIIYNKYTIFHFSLALKYLIGKIDSEMFHVPVAQWLEHCVSSAKVVGSIPREHTHTDKKMYSLNAL